MRNTVDGIIKYQGGIVLIERSKAPLGLALPGGKVEENESLEDAFMREMREETNLHVMNVRQFHTYSAPDRDPRERMISTVFVADGSGTLRAGSDAKRCIVVPLSEIAALAGRFAFDHQHILKDYTIHHPVGETLFAGSAPHDYCDDSSERGRT